MAHAVGLGWAVGVLGACGGGGGRSRLFFVRFGGGVLLVAFVLRRFLGGSGGVTLSLDKFLGFAFFVEIWAVYESVLLLACLRWGCVLLGGTGAIFYILYAPYITYPFSIKGK